MPNAPKTPTRTIRVSDELWKSVQDAAAAQDITVTSVVIDALKAFVSQHAESVLTPEK